MNKTKRPISVLVYGDSNTWGYDPNSGRRFPQDIRWPKVFENCLAGLVEVIEEGLNGRTVLSFMPGSSPVNGAEYFPSCAAKYAPVDLMILFLGINDLFQPQEPPLTEIIRGAGQIVRHAREEIVSDRFQKPILILPPLPVNPQGDGSYLYASLIEKSKDFPEKYRRLAEETDSLFIDISQIIEASPLDGVHIEAEHHIMLGNFICDFIRKTFAGR